MLGGIEKMSKSKNNVVEPKDIIAKFGADTARVFTMFAGPPDQSAAWSDSGAEGAFRFLRRLWNAGVRLAPRLAAAARDDGRRQCARPPRCGATCTRLLRQVSHDYERLQYNTVVSGAMKMLNAIEDARLGDGAADAAVQCARPSASCCARCTRRRRTSRMRCGANSASRRVHGEIIDAPWPQVDEAALVQDEIELVLQISGKLRGAIRVPAGADRAAIEAAALATPEFARFAEGKPAKKVVVVPGRLVNVVV